MKTRIKNRTVMEAIQQRFAFPDPSIIVESAFSYDDLGMDHKADEMQRAECWQAFQSLLDSQVNEHGCVTDHDGETYYLIDDDLGNYLRTKDEMREDYRNGRRPCVYFGGDRQAWTSEYTGEDLFGDQEQYSDRDSRDEAAEHPSWRGVLADGTAAKVHTVVDAEVRRRTPVARSGRRVSDRALAKVGVQVISRRIPTLACLACRQQWSPNVGAGGRLPRGWWKCPHGCND